MFGRIKNLSKAFKTDIEATVNYVEMLFMVGTGLGIIFFIRYLINSMGESGITVPEQIVWVFPVMIIALVIFLGYAVYERYYK